MLRNMIIFNKNMEKYIRKVTRVGKRSLSVVIPSGKKIVIEDWE